MELHPTPESWRIALLTAIASIILVAAGAVAVALRGDSTSLLVAGIVVGVAALATFVPALGAVTASVDADIRGVTVRRLGFTSRYGWGEVTAIRVVERQAQVPDGTQYHWFIPGRAKHVVAVPSLELTDGRVRELPALAAPAYGRRRAAANQQAKRLNHLRGLTLKTEPEQVSRVG